MNTLTLIQRFIMTTFCLLVGLSCPTVKLLSLPAHQSEQKEEHNESPEQSSQKNQEQSQEQPQEQAQEDNKPLTEEEKAEFAALIQMLMEQQKLEQQKNAASGESAQEHLSEKDFIPESPEEGLLPDMDYGKVTQVAAGLYGVWRKYQDIYAFDRANDIPDWEVGEKMWLADKIVIRPVGTVAVLAKRLRDAGIDDTDKFLRVLQSNPSFPEWIIMNGKRAYDDGSSWETEYPFLQQMMIKFAPIFLYHGWWNGALHKFVNDKCEGNQWYDDHVKNGALGYFKALVAPENEEFYKPSGGYKTSSSDNSFGGKRGSFEPEGQEVDGKRPNDTKKKGFVLEAQFELDKINRGEGSWIPGKKELLEAEIADFNKKALDPEWEIHSSGGKSHYVKNSSLYRAALRSVVGLGANKVDHKLSEQIEKRISKEKLATLKKYSLGALSPALLWPLCQGVATLMLHDLSKAVNDAGMDDSDKASWTNSFLKQFIPVMPSLSQTDLGIVETSSYGKEKMINEKPYDGSVLLTKNRDTYENGYITGSWGSAKFLLNKVGETAMVNVGAYLGPLIAYKLIEKREKILSWPTWALNKFGSIFVKLGITKENPVSRVGNGVSNQAYTMLGQNPMLFHMLVSATSALEMQKETAEAMQSGDQLGSMMKMMMVSGRYDGILKQLDECLKLKKKREVWQKRRLLLSSDEKYRELERNEKALMKDALERVKSEGLFSRLIDVAFMAVTPYFAEWGARTYGREYGESAFKFGKMHGESWLSRIKGKFYGAA